jgi:septum formation protein
MKINDLILASQSKIRREILEISQIPFRVCPSDIDEKKITCESSRSLAQKRAIAKAKDLANKNPGSVVIGCDQVLSFENKVFSKPKSPEDAFAQLKSLQGKEHWLYSAVALYYGQKSQSLKLAAWVSPVKMQMHPLCDDLILEYVSTGEWQGSVGGYKIEGKGRALFASFEPREDKSVIMGLPLPELLQKMRELGLYHPETGLASVLN